MTIKISIITATFNAAELIPALAESLLNQIDMDFEWVVADGGSSDQTVSYLQSLVGIDVKVDVQEDFGIYDAINRAVRLSTGDYYLVLGADDRLYPQAIQQFKISCKSESYDIVSASVDTDGGKLIPGSGSPYLRGQLAYISQHSVGTLIKKNLHGRFGYYSRRFPIAADHYFIKRVCEAPDTIIHYADFVAGYYPGTGVSGSDVAGSMAEFFRVQLETEKSSLLQILLFMVRMLRHLPKLLAYAKKQPLGKH